MGHLCRDKTHSLITRVHFQHRNDERSVVPARTCVVWAPVCPVVQSAQESNFRTLTLLDAAALLEVCMCRVHHSLLACYDKSQHGSTVSRRRTDLYP